MKKENWITIKKRKIGTDYTPLVIAEIGINHNGNIQKAIEMIKDAADAGAECVKFQRHVVDDEMTLHAKKVIPGNAKESIWEMMIRCSLTHQQHIQLKNLSEKLGLIYLCTPFSRAAADSLIELGVDAFKIGSGECNNYPLIKYIASFKKPVILSTGMNDMGSIKKAVQILDNARIRYAILHCTSMYPTPYNKVKLGVLNQLKKEFPNTPVGLSDHSIGNYTSFAAVALGASIIEKHFTSSKRWKGSDIPLSITPKELSELIAGTKAIHQALGGTKEILKEEKPTIDFAYSSVVSTKDIKKGERFSSNNLWVKKPGTGEILAVDLERVVGKNAKRDIGINNQLKWADVKKN